MFRVPVAPGPATSLEAAQGLAYAKALREARVRDLEGGVRVEVHLGVLV